jgi:hypothetical protein
MFTKLENSWSVGTILSQATFSLHNYVIIILILSSHPLVFLLTGLLSSDRSATI